MGNSKKKIVRNSFVLIVVFLLLLSNSILIINAKITCDNIQKQNNNFMNRFIQNTDNNNSRLSFILKLIIISLILGVPLFFLLKHVQNHEKMEYVLHGTIVTMNGMHGTIPNGNILISDGLIKEIWTDDETPSHNISNLPYIDTMGYIFPGLIDCHNHLMYNTIPIWNVSQKYNNRYEWRESPNYYPDIKSPSNILVRSDNADLLSETVKYAEVKALVGGTTAIHGANIPNPAFTNSLVRNIESYNIGECRLLNTVENISSWKGIQSVVLLNKLGVLDTFLIHLAEGTDDRSHNEFEILKDKGLLIDPLVSIHSIPLNRSDYAELAESGANMIWSPTSNLLLYGATANVKSAWEEGVCVGLSPDWSPSGTKNSLGELKIADQWNKDKLDGFFSDYNLTEMVITNPAKMCGWENRCGKIEEGFQADLVVIDKYNDIYNPYRSLINAIDFDVKLVTVGGDPLYGLVEYINLLKPFDYEILEFDGWTRALDITKDSVADGEQLFSEISDTLAEVMTFDPEILYEYFDVGDMTFDEFLDWLDEIFWSGLHPVPLDPINTYGDSAYFHALEESENLNSNFNCNLSFYYDRAPIE
ncbi:MAG: amidohydrolase family protein [Candidatus Lokiarchaeota archaeon]|nr:amidohydrolase family protein [Candidatus Lokiarchaeota archaeon]